MHCPGLLAVAVIHIVQSQLSEDRNYFILQLLIAHHQRKPTQELEAETTKGIDDWLAPRPTFCHLYYTVQAHLHGVELPTMGWTLPHESTIRKRHKGMPIGQSDEGNSSIKVSSS